MKLIERLKNWLCRDHNAQKVAVLGLIAIGTILIYTVGPYAGARIGQGPDFFFNKYVPFLLWGIGILAVGSMLPRKWIVRIAGLWLGIGLILILASYLFPVVIMGAARYVRLFGYNIDPYVLTLPAYIVMMSHWLGTERDNQRRATILITVLTVAIIWFAMRAPYILMSLIYMAVFLIMTFRARKNMPTLSKVGTTLALAMAVVLLVAFLKIDHMYNLIGNEYATRASVRTIFSASLIDTNADALKNLGYVVSSISDYGFTGLLARFGFCAGALLLALYAWLGGALARNARTSRHPFYALLNTGTLVMLVIYLFFSLTTAFGILPVAGYLPLVSYSPCGLIAFCALFGSIFSER